MNFGRAKAEQFYFSKVDLTASFHVTKNTIYLDFQEGTVPLGINSALAGSLHCQQVAKPSLWTKLIPYIIFLSRSRPSSAYKRNPGHGVAHNHVYRL